MSPRCLKPFICHWQGGRTEGDLEGSGSAGHRFPLISGSPPSSPPPSYHGTTIKNFSGFHEHAMPSLSPFSCAVSPAKNIAPLPLPSVPHPLCPASANMAFSLGSFPCPPKSELGSPHLGFSGHLVKLLIVIIFCCHRLRPLVAWKVGLHISLSYSIAAPGLGTQ